MSRVDVKGWGQGVVGSRGRVVEVGVVRIKS